MDAPKSERPQQFLATAVLFELAMGVLALALGWLLDIDPSRDLFPEDRISGLIAVAVGGGGALLMFAGVLLIHHYPWGPLAGLQRLVKQLVAPLFQDVSVAGLAAISLAAGWGEELLFRGFLQAGIADWIGSGPGALVGLVVASVGFGLCHWLSPTYAVVTVLIGFLLGATFLATGSLLAPIVMHGLYDFLALRYLTRATPA